MQNVKKIIISILYPSNLVTSQETMVSKWLNPFVVTRHFSLIKVTVYDKNGKFTIFFFIKINFSLESFNFEKESWKKSKYSIRQENGITVFHRKWKFIFDWQLIDASAAIQNDFRRKDCLWESLHIYCFPKRSTCPFMLYFCR